MRTEDIPTGEVHPYERNAKEHDGRQIANVMESIRQYGFTQPIVVDKNNTVIIGHCRLQAAKRLRLETVPAVRMEDLTEEEANKLRLLDNKLNESPWDYTLLAEDVPEIDWTGYDIEWALPEEKDPEEIDEDEIPEPPEEPETKLGDVYVLGKHRLICGDATDSEVIAKLMGGQKADLYITDPPYNVALGHYMSEEEAKILRRRTDGLVIDNDAWENEDDFIGFLTAAFTAANKSIREGGAFYIWHAHVEGKAFMQATQNTGWKVRQALVWNKHTFAMGRQDYQWKHEACIYGWKDGAAHYFTDSRQQTTVIEDASEIRPERMKKDELVRLVRDLLEERVSTTVLNEKKPSRSEDHPTMKPVRLIARLVRNSSRPGEIILDSFGGSGTTLIAAEQLGRECRMAELDPHYCDVIVKRWEKLTGKKAERLDG